MKENQQVQPVISDDGRSVTFKVRNRPDIVLDMTALHPAIIARAACAGMAQVRIMDAAAVGRADDEGNVRSEDAMLDEKHRRMSELVAHYMTGTAEWTRKGSGGGGARSLTIEAIANVMGETYDDTLAKIDARAEAAGVDRKKLLATLAKAAAVAAEMKRLRDARMPAPSVDADAALDALKSA